MAEEKKGNGLSRRTFLKNIGGGAIGTAVISTGLIKTDGVNAYIPESVGTARRKTAVNLKVNGKNYRVEVEHRETLAEVLRDQLGLTGTKIGCDRGECGACTVIVNGRNLYSCSQLAVWMQGKDILTIEGLAKGDKLDPVQEAFIEHDGPQCGFCTSGQIMSGKALLLKNSKPTEAQARRGLSGNLCRCGNYNREVAAVLAAAAKAR
jgi:aerobic-type carbon monoxide dehydrogenase small subunit (CoxS/CutS family)